VASGGVTDGDQCGCDRWQGGQWGCDRWPGGRWGRDRWRGGQWGRDRWRVASGGQAAALNGERVARPHSSVKRWRSWEECVHAPLSSELECVECLSKKLECIERFPQSWNVLNVDEGGVD